MPDKVNQRRRAKERRDQLNEAQRESASQTIADRVVSLEWYKKADQVLVYIPVNSEVDTRPLIEKAWAQGKPVYAPVVDEKNKSMAFYRFEAGESLVAGPYGVEAPKPVASRKADMGRPCLILCPCLAFDREGVRLGYGAGFYDRFLGGPAQTWKRVALAFAAQEDEKPLTVDDHDQRMHAVVTEKEVIELPSKR